MLTFWYQIRSEDECAYDFGGIVANDMILTRFDLCETTSTLNWQLRSVNLQQFVGQTIALQVRAETDGVALSSLYIDDIAFERLSSTGD
jgi:hypothetical protein